MDKMSIIKLILVTVPESIFSIYIALLITGQRLKLPLKCFENEKKKSITRLIIAVSLFSVVQLIGRAYINDLYIYSIYNVIISTIILRYIYGDNYPYDKDKKLIINIIHILNLWIKPILQVFIIFCVLMTIENLYLPSVMKLLNINSYQEAFKLPWANLLLPQVDRFFQFLVITLLWDFSRVNNNIKNYKYNKKLFVVLFLYLMIFEFSVSYLYLRYFDIFSNVLKLLFFILLSSMSIFNIYVYKATLDIVDKTYLHNKKGEKCLEKANS